MMGLPPRVGEQSRGQVVKLHSVRLATGYEISDERARLDFDVIHRALAQAYWAVGRLPALTQRSWNNCLGIGLYAPEGAMVGFARVLTDYALRAHLADVFVEPSSRGAGLGKSLVRTVLDHPELATVVKWTLTTGDAHALYTLFGFRTSTDDPTWMTLDRS